MANTNPASCCTITSPLFGGGGWAHGLPWQPGNWPWQTGLARAQPHDAQCQDEFPYVVRLISEITESNGSSSMATVCGSSLALMDAGAPLKKPVAGIAMGLIKEGEDFAVLSDILGDEDHLGDMDFKVAGSADGITALQMDIKITSITPEIMEIALAKPRMAAFISWVKWKRPWAPRGRKICPCPQIVTIQINKDKIRDVIGSGGKVIREITETTGATIDIEEDGTINIAASDANKIAEAKEWIEGITGEPEEGKIYQGTVVNTKDFERLRQLYARP